ncbi:uncharacterized protein LOC117319750 [Pecten maximus]|uniref:uncharacterized protein LOC117319750 n=1 Tax=Pecten maximus TaxID=6579 RepID=UPI0014584545|nr:uncharacterized protein LOC117319750 [Pecten maximus]
MATKSKLYPLVSLPRPAWALFDRSGHLPIHGALQYTVDGQAELSRLEFPTNTLKQAFAIREKTKCSPKLHQIGFCQDCNISMHVSIPMIGKTSYSIFHDLFDSATMERMLHIETKLVNINPETRRPSQLPSAFTEQYTDFKSDYPVLITDAQEDLVLPTNAFKTLIRTRYSDTDQNSHVNYSEYYRFCADCASEASRSGYYRHYADDICRFPVLETDVTFIGESPACSNLDVYTWQDNVNVQIINFAIYLKSDRIFQAQFLYSFEKSPRINSRF